MTSVYSKESIVGVDSCSIEIPQKDFIFGQSNVSLDGYYTVKLGFSGNLDDDLNLLYEYYRDNMTDIYKEEELIKDTLYEYVKLFDTRGLNGLEFVASKISMVGRKSSKEKKNLGYLIGCLRNTLEYGISTTGSVIERRLISTFESLCSVRLSPRGVQRLLSLSTLYGITDILFTLIENSLDVEELLLDRFEEFLKMGRNE